MRYCMNRMRKGRFLGRNGQDSVMPTRCIRAPIRQAPGENRFARAPRAPTQAQAAAREQRRVRPPDRCRAAQRPTRRSPPGSGRSPPRAPAFRAPRRENRLAG